MKNVVERILEALLSIGMLSIIAVVAIIALKEFGAFDNISAETQAEVTDFVSKITPQNTIDSVEVPNVITGDLQGVPDVDSQGANQQINYNTADINRYLYNQIEEPSKYIYKAFEENKEAMKTGTAKVQLGDYFTELLNSQNGDTDLLSKYYQSAVEAYTYDNPDVFYLDPNKMYLSVGTTKYSNGKVEYDVFIGNQGISTYLIDEFSSADDINYALAQMQQIRNEVLSRRTGNTLNDIKMVHDYLINTVEYDETLSRGNIYNIYGALVNKVCVCEGYAKAFKYILDEMGVQCILAVGTGTNSQGQSERHAWNYVEYNGTWYAVDVTWDDPVVIGGGQASSTDKTKYFMKRGNDFNNTHFLNRQFTEGGKVFEYPNV